MSTARQRLDLDAVHALLRTTPWASTGMPREVLQRAMENSVCVGVYRGRELVGFARAVTDLATSADFGFGTDTGGSTYMERRDEG